MAVTITPYNHFLPLVMKGEIDLADDVIRLALVDSNYLPEREHEDWDDSYSAWSGSTGYEVGDLIVPTTRNGHFYKCTAAGTSGSTEPTWSTSSGGTVTDGGVTWEEQGGDSPGNHEITGTGYAENGAALGNKTVKGRAENESIPEGDAWWDADDVVWSSATLTCRYGILFHSSTGKLIAWILFNDAPADVSVTGTDFTVQWPVDHILKLEW